MMDEIEIHESGNAHEISKSQKKCPNFLFP